MELISGGRRPVSQADISNVVELRNRYMRAEQLLNDIAQRVTDALDSGADIELGAHEAHVETVRIASQVYRALVVDGQALWIWHSRGRPMPAHWWLSDRPPV